MAGGPNGYCEYYVEVSGWGLNDTFFVEKTDLVWTEDGTKKLRLRRCLSERAMIIVRLLGTDTALSSLPVAYQVENVQPMTRMGLCEMALREVHPRSRHAGPRPTDPNPQRNPAKATQTQRTSNKDP